MAKPGLTPTWCVIALAVLVLSPASTASAQTPVPLSLAQAVERALGSNRAIAAARLRRPVDLAGVDVARERPNPEVAYEATKETPRQSIGGSLPIELGGKRQARIGAATAMVAVGDAELARVIAEIRAEVRRAYFQVVAADRRVAFAGELRGLATRARDAARARADAGDVPRADVTQASLVLAGTENEVTAAGGEAAAARAELNSLLGQPSATPLVLSDAIGDGALMSLEGALTQATQSNTTLRLLDRLIDAQAARVRLARALRTPDVTAGSALTYDAQPEFSYGWKLSGTIMLPVFTSHRAGVVVEETELVRLKAERGALEAAMEGAIAAALARAQSARERMTRYQNDILPLAVEAERQAQISYSAGQTGLVALIESLRTARETRQAGLQAAEEFQRALADLERAMGAALP